MLNVLSNDKQLSYMINNPIFDFARDKVLERALNLTEHSYGSEAAAYGGLYTDNILRNNKMSPKRIKKYIDKVRDKIQDYIYKACKANVTVEEFCLSNVLSAWGRELKIKEILAKESDPMNRGPSRIFTPIYESLLTSDGSFKDNKEFLEGSICNAIGKIFTSMLINETNTNKVEKDLLKIATDEFNNSVINHLCKLFVAEENINKDNCFTYIPGYDGCTLIIADYSTILYYAIERYFMKKSYEELAKAELNNIKIRLVDKINQSTDIIKKLSKNKAVLEIENQKLKRQLTEEEKNKSPTGSNIFKELNEEKKKRKKTEEKYAELLDKYNELKEMIEDKDADEKNDDSEKDKNYDLKEEDRYRRYAFVIDDWAKFHTELMKEFPNATIITKSNYIIPQNSHELVILMPFHASHSHYYRMKSQCKAKNIKFTHYNSTNIEGLKKHIARVLIEEKI